MSRRRSRRSVVIHSPLSPKDARARIRRELETGPIGTPFAALEVGRYVTGWVQTYEFRLRGHRRIRPYPWQTLGWAPPTLRLRGTVEVDGVGCRLVGRFDPTLLRRPRGRREDDALRAWLVDLLDGEEQ